MGKVEGPSSVEAFLYSWGEGEGGGRRRKKEREKELLNTSNDYKPCYQRKKPQLLDFLNQLKCPRNLATKESTPSWEMCQESAGWWGAGRLQELGAVPC